jgi:hypothetical protein
MSRHNRPVIEQSERIKRIAIDRFGVDEEKLNATVERIIGVPQLKNGNGCS